MSLLLQAARALPRPLIEQADRVRKRLPLLDRLVRLTLSRGPENVVTIAQGAGAGLRLGMAGAVLRYGLGMAEDAVQEVLVKHLRAGAVFYDVGANVGFLTLIGARLVGEAGRVVAFEPMPETAVMLRENVARNGFTQVTVLEVAIGAGRGQAELVLEETSQMAHLSTVPGMAASSSTQRIAVEVVSLDDLIHEGLPVPTLIKIDIEGAEVDALTGMHETLDAHHPTVVCEIHDTLDEVSAALESHGYTLQRLVDAHGSSLDHILATYPSEA